MIIASHQVDLLPYSGFWYKLAKADLLDLKIFDRFQPRGYQRRVVMRGQWASIPVIGGSQSTLISDVRIHPGKTRDLLIDIVTERYEGGKHWATAGQQVIGMIEQIHTEHLWQFNLHLILGIRDLLGIRTPISIAGPPRDHGDAGIAEVMHQYGATTYLSGAAEWSAGGFSEVLEDAGIDLKWSKHEPVTGESILSVLVDYDNPRAVVMSERAPQLAGAGGQRYRA